MTKQPATRDNVEALLEPSNVRFAFIEYAGKLWLAVAVRDREARGWDKTLERAFGLFDWRSPSAKVEAMAGRRDWMMVALEG